MSDADEMAHMLCHASIDYAWSREGGQLCLTVSQLGFTFDGAEQLAGVLVVENGEGESEVEAPLISPLNKAICELQRLRNLATPDRWPVYDRALRALESL